MARIAELVGQRDLEVTADTYTYVLLQAGRVQPGEPPLEPRP